MDIEEQNDHNDQQEESFQEPEVMETTFYPPKPEPTPMANKLTRSVISSGLFIVLAYFILDWEILFIVKLICVLLIHEMGHYAAMHRFNYKDLSIFFVPLVGAVATGEKEEISRKQSIIILLAGPVPGIIIGTAIYAASVFLKNNELLNLAMIFIFLNAFNLLPFTPLDGGKILKALFFENNLIIGAVFSILSAVGLAVISIYLQSYFLLILPLFILIQLNSSYALHKLAKLLRSKKLPVDCAYSELTNKNYWEIRDEMGRNLSSLKRFIQPGHYEVSVNEERIMSTMRQLVRKPPANDLSVIAKIGFVVLWIASFVIPLVIMGVVYMMTQGV